MSEDEYYSPEHLRTRAALRALRPCISGRPCDICTTQLAPGRTMSLATVPGATSGSTEHGLVPLGYLYDVLVDAQGHVLYYDAGAGPVVCSRDSDAARALVGYWQTETGPNPGAMGTDFAPRSALWLRADGTYVRGRSGWTMEVGAWVTSESGIVLRPTLRLRNSGGQAGGESDRHETQQSTPSCEAERPAHPLVEIRIQTCPAGSSGQHVPCRRFDDEALYRVTDAAEMDEDFYRRGCTGDWTPPR